MGFYPESGDSLLFALRKRQQSSSDAVAPPEFEPGILGVALVMLLIGIFAICGTERALVGRLVHALKPLDFGDGLVGIHEGYWMRRHRTGTPRRGLEAALNAA